MTRLRRFVSIRMLPGILMLALLSPAPVALAQGGPAVEPAFSNELLSDLGLPEITLTQSEDGTVEGLPDALAADTYLVTLTSAGDFASYVNVVLPPDGLSEDEGVEQMLDTARNDVLHQGWVYGGGSYVIGEGELSFAIDLEPGEWQIAISRQVGDEGEEIMQLFPLTVTGESVEPEATAGSAVAAHQILELRDVEFDGLLFPVLHGPSIWQIANTGEQPRQVVFWRAPRQVSPGEFTEAMLGTPVVDGFDPAELTWVGYAAILSPGQQIWLELDLTAGDYLAVSYVLDPETGMTAFALGMVDAFSVVDESDEGEVSSG